MGWDEHLKTMQHKSEIQKKVTETGIEPPFKRRPTAPHMDRLKRLTIKAQDPKTYKRVRKDKCMPDIDERRMSAEVWNTKQDGAAPPLALQENDCVPGIFRTHTETKTLTVHEDAPIRQSADCMPGAFRRYRFNSD